MNLRIFSNSRIREERGWALMDAIASVLVVAAAFTATTAAFNVSTRSAAREGKNTQGLALAQSQLNWMRSVGQNSEAELLALNGQSKMIPYRGTNFTVTYTAIQSAGIGEGGVEACSADLSTTSETAPLPDDRHYVYMRVVVRYPGQVVTAGPTTGTGFNSAEPIALDSNFAAEGGLSDQTSGMLRVYVVDPQLQPVSTVNGVLLRKSGSTSDLTPIAKQVDKGCYLFGGLSAGDYSIKVDAAGMQDVYMSAASNVIQRTYTMPTGVMRSTSVIVASPVSVKPVYKVKTGASTSIDISPQNSSQSASINDFVKAPTGTGLWTAYSDDVQTAKNSSYFINSGGAYFPYIPAANSGSVDKSMVYPTLQGWDGFAGPCRANDPKVATQQLNVPFDLSSPTWPTGGSTVLNPTFWLSGLKAKAVMNPYITVRPGDSGTTGPDTDVGWPSTKSETYYWNQGGPGFNGQIQVALVGDKDGKSDQPGCNSGYQLGSTAGNTTMWKRIPGTVTTQNADLDDVATALPVGKYEICARLYFKYNYQEYKVWWDWFTKKTGWQGSVGTGDALVYMKGTVQTLGYQSNPTATTVNFSPPSGGWKAIYSSSASTSSGTCGDPAKWS